jgi:hypothetical protein
LITWVPTADGVDHLGASLRVWVGLLGFTAGLGRVAGFHCGSGSGLWAG